jgi:hypothetical protein
MTKGKASRDTWIDPDAPTELLGDVNARLNDLFMRIKDSIDELSAFGVDVSLSNDGPTYQLRGASRELTAVARAAYSLGYDYRDLLFLRCEFEGLLAKLGGTLKSVQSRQRTKTQRDNAFLKLYADKLAQGPVSIESLCREVGIKRATGYGILSRFNESLDQQAHAMRRAQPRIASRQIVDALLEQRAGQPGITRETIEKAIGENRRKK